MSTQVTFDYLASPETKKPKYFWLSLMTTINNEQDEIKK